MKKSFHGLLLCSIWLLCAFLLSLSSAEGVFEVVSPGDISGYQSNPLNVTAPEEGALCIEIRDENTLYRKIEKNVPSGKSQVIWDGLGWNEERMAHKQYTLEAVLTGASGKEYHAGTAITVVPAQQAVLFALPSDPDVYLADPSDWFLEFKILYTDQLVAEFFLDSSGEMMLRASRQAKGARVNKISFSALTGKHTLKSGTYRVQRKGYCRC